MGRRFSPRVSGLVAPLLVACAAPGDTSSDVAAQAEAVDAAAGPVTSDP